MFVEGLLRAGRGSQHFPCMNQLISMTLCDLGGLSLPQFTDGNTEAQ